jgi:hypothetical protein
MTRLVVPGLCALFLLLAGYCGWAAEGKGGTAVTTGERVVLDGVDRYRVVEPVAEAVRIVLAYRGEKVSPAYVQGLSGAAFKVAGPCPCAPTCWGTMEPAKLARLFGYEVEQIDVGAPYDAKAFPAEASEAARKARMQAALLRIKDEIRAKRPVVLVHAFTYWEYDVVCGFDESTHELYGRGSYDAMRVDAYTHAGELRALAATEIGGGPYAVLIGAKTGSLDAKEAELAALREAVAHAHTQASGKALLMGLECYDAWIGRYRHQGDHMTAKGLPPDEYPLGILPSTRQAASEFMTELAAKYPAAKAHLELAAEEFTRESEALAAARARRGTLKESPTEEECARMAGLLSQARAMYALAIDDIGRAIPLLEAAK